MRIVLLGAPGSGKGTQAALLEKQLGVPHISTGVLFRAAVEEGTELGLKVRSILDRGELVPDDLTLDPKTKPYFAASARLRASSTFSRVWLHSDLPAIVERFAETAAHRHHHLDKHPEKTESKIFPSKSGAPHRR